MDSIDQRIENLHVNIESLHSSLTDLYATVQQQSENIQALLHIAEIHERRLTNLEGGEEQ